MVRSQTAPAANAPDYVFHPVRYTRQASRRYNRGQTRIQDLLLDAYLALLTLGTVGLLVAGMVLALREQVVQRWNTPDGAGAGSLLEVHWALPPGVVPTALVFTALAAAGTVARRMGPASVERAAAYWWLGLPVDRRPLVVGPLLRRLLLAGLGGAVLYLPFGFVTQLKAPLAGQFLGAAVCGLSAVSMVLSAALRQESRTRFFRGPLPTLALAALLSVLPGWALSEWAVPGSAPAAAPGTAGPPDPAALVPAAAALAAAVVLWLVVSPRLNQISGSELSRGGAVSGHVGASLYLMDTNELGRALASTPRGGPSFLAGRWYARGGRTPFTALLRADVTAFLRTPGLWGRPVLLLVLCLGVLAAVPLPAAAQLGVVGLTVCAAVPPPGALARRTAITPGLDALLPIPPAAVRLSRLALPSASLMLWSAALSSGLVLLGAGSPELIALGALAGVGFGAAAVRGAYRPLPDWTAPPTETVFGPVPSSQMGSLGQGLDTTLLAVSPLLLGLFLGSVPPLLLALEAVFSIACVLIVAFSNPK